ncbi:hypothetical protein [Bradyrhizobium algeriense]|uniref:hypothetical protein n=1 Tax=Bradyrhizobium algeriense TaxID=634784 RepID=UPI002FF25DF4
MVRRTTTGAATRTATKEVSYATTAYEDFVIVAKRRNAREIGVRIDASPAGRMAEEETVAFPVEEGVELRASFFSGSARGGRAEITIDEAVAIGTRLADVLFPKTVFRLFAESLGKVVGRPNTGLRIRLDMLLDPSILIRNVMAGWSDAGACPTAWRNAAISSGAAGRRRSKPAGRRFEKS